MKILNGCCSRDLEGRQFFTFGFMSTEQTAYARVDPEWPSGLHRPATPAACFTYEAVELAPLQGDGSALTVCGITVAATSANEQILKKSIGIGFMARKPMALQARNNAKVSNLCVDGLDILDLALFKLPDVDNMSKLIMMPDPVNYKDVEHARGLTNSRPASIAYWAVRMNDNAKCPVGGFTLSMFKGGFSGKAAQVLAVLLSRAETVTAEADGPLVATFEEMCAQRQLLLEQKEAMNNEKAYLNRTQRVRADFSRLSIEDREELLRSFSQKE